MFSPSISEQSGYTIANSLRLRSSASAYLSRTPASAGNLTTWTWAGWFKRGAFADTFLFSANYNAGAGFTGLRFLSDSLDFVSFNGAAATQELRTSRLFRDPSAWYHVVMVHDTNNATSTDRLRMYINGVRETAFQTASFPASGFSAGFNSNVAHTIAANWPGGSNLDGYLSDVYFIDGQALDPSYFGTTNIDGVWTPKAYTGTYGTNGFYLKFNDGSNLTNLCLDRSGNGNNWTSTNVSLTAGATYDWMVDTPTNNYAVLNPLQSFASITYSANLTIYYANTASWATAASTFAVSSGKWYWETTHSNIVHTTSETLVGILANTSLSASLLGNLHVGMLSGGYGYYSADGTKYNNGVGVAYGSALTNNDVLGIALDADAGTITFYKNNTSLGTAYSGLTGPYMPAVSSRSGVVEINFGQRPFAYTPPTGFKALCTANLPAVTVTNGRKNFDVVAYTGNGATQSITGLQFQPDLGWIKCRSFAHNHLLFDSVRGKTASNYNVLFSNLTNAETNYPITSLDSGGFTVTNSAGSANAANESGLTFASWLWKAGGVAVTNTAGSITSQVSANTAAGFSIVTYTGTGANATVGHGLGVAPKMVIVKTRSVGTYDWCVYHASMTSASYYMPLNGTAAQTLSTNVWNATAPTSSVVSIGTSVATNTSAGTHVMYCFAEVPGFSKFGSLVGNGVADGVFAYTGFKPRWILLKNITAASAHWTIYDTARDTYNVAANELAPNNSNAENGTVAAGSELDILSNGFKFRTLVNNEINVSGNTYIFAAFAEHPFGGSNVAPATAR